MQFINAKKSSPKSKLTITDRIISWQEGETGFYKWLSDIKPRILVRNGRYEIFEPTDQQRKLIHETFAMDETEKFVHAINLSVQPRRHGKSTVFALFVLFFFTSRNNFTAQLLGASEDHCRRTMFNRLKAIINHTQNLQRMIPKDNQFAYTIHFPQLGNVIQYTASNLSTSFGDRLNLLWVSDLHAFLDLGPFNALQASLLDSDDSLLFIDSNVDETDGPVHGLEKEAAADTGIFCQLIRYRDLDEYCDKAPAWIDRAKARRLERTSLPADFKRDILGQRSDAKNALFTKDIIESAKRRYSIPVVNLKDLVNGRAYKVGGGLDRAKSLIAGPRGDFTVWTVVLKVANHTGEPEYYILNQVKFLINSGKAIKAQILEDHRRYKLDNSILENYEVSDIYSWLLEQQVPCELISAHDTNQRASFPEMYRVFKEGRFYYPDGLKDFAGELSTFTYTRRKNGSYSFGHASTKFHDDRVYSTNWAIFSLRKEVLNLYEIDSIVCKNRNSKRQLCFLFGGSVEFKHCSRNCTAFQEVKALWLQYREFNDESEVTLPVFFNSMVRVTGAKVYQAV